MRSTDVRLKQKQKSTSVGITWVLVKKTRKDVHPLRADARSQVRRTYTLLTHDTSPPKKNMSYARRMGTPFASTSTSKTDVQRQDNLAVYSAEYPARHPIGPPLDS